MADRSVWQRWRAARLTAADRARVRAELWAGVGALSQGDSAAAAPALAAAHAAARNSGRLHLAAHLGFLAAHLQRRDLASARAELAPLALAAPSAWLRCAAGVPPEAPPAGSLWATWRERGVQ